MPPAPPLPPACVRALEAVCPGQAGAGAVCMQCLKQHQSDAAIIAACPLSGAGTKMDYGARERYCGIVV